MKLTPRLAKIVEAVPKSMCVGDIGTDHAYIPIELINKKICKRSIATDIAQGPVNNAIESIKREGLYDDNIIEIRMGSGLEPYEVGEIDTAIFAGMGGELICDILKEYPDKVNSIKNFVFQPMIAQEKLRKWLHQNGFCITCEYLAKETYHIYEIFTAIHNSNNLCISKSENNSNISTVPNQLHTINNSTTLFINNDICDELFYEIGMLPLKKHDMLTIDFIKSKIRKTSKIINGMKKSKSNNLKDKIINLEIKLSKLHKILYDISN